MIAQTAYNPYLAARLGHAAAAAAIHQLIYWLGKLEGKVANGIKYIYQPLHVWGEVLGLSRQGAGRLMARLERQGYIQRLRLRSHDWKQVYYYALTDQCECLLAEVEGLSFSFLNREADNRLPGSEQSNTDLSLNTKRQNKERIPQNSTQVDKEKPLKRQEKIRGLQLEQQQRRELEQNTTLKQEEDQVRREILLKIKNVVGSLSVGLVNLVGLFDADRILMAIAALQQARQGKRLIRNPAGWLYAAIVGGFKPNPGQQGAPVPPYPTPAEMPADRQALAQELARRGKGGDGVMRGDAPAAIQVSEELPPGGSLSEQRSSPLLLPTPVSSLPPPDLPGPIDWSEAIAFIKATFLRLGWDKAEQGQFLTRHYGRNDTQYLTDQQLLDCLQRLRGMGPGG